MTNTRPPCQFFTPNIESKPQFRNADKEFKAQSYIESQPSKKPRISEVVSNSKKTLPCSFFKTRLCNNFKMGSCRYGQRCRFAHGIGDIRKIMPDWEGLETEKKGLLAMTWNARQCHRNSNDVCRLFSNGRKCIYGDNCRYLHVFPENIRDKSVISISTTGAKGYLVKSGIVQNSKTCTSVLTPRMGIGAAYCKQLPGMECNFKWNELEKLSRIYADWIEDMPLLHGSSSKLGC